MRAARVRTESMAQRLAKKPISEGFELWDRGYVLGAMRLFIFKAENSPPFQLGPCLDAVGHLLAQLEEAADAKENFGYAAEKYDLIQQPILGQLMNAKGVEQEYGPVEALKKVQALLGELDAKREAASSSDVKLKMGLGRLYHYNAQLLCATNGDLKRALEDAQYSVILGWDRVHLGYLLVGEILAQLGDVPGAVNALEQAIKANPNCASAYNLLIQLLRETGDKERSMTLLDKAIELHPKSALIRDKAFLMSENDNDEEALKMLDSYIASPPHEEAEALVMGGQTSCTLYKAKAAILADMGKLEDALAAAQDGVKMMPGDEEALRMVDDLTNPDSPLREKAKQ